MSRPLLMILASLCTLMCAPGRAPASETLTACFETWPPYQFFDQDGVARGVTVDLTRRVLADLDVDVTFEDLPYPRCVFHVQNGNFDMIVSSGAEEGLVVAEPAKVSWVIGVFVRDDLAIDHVDELGQRGAVRVGVAHGFEFPSTVVQSPAWVLEPERNDILNFRKLAHGRIDAVLTDVPWALNLPAEDRLGARYVPPAVQAIPQPDAFRPGLEGLRDRYQTRLRSLIDEGALDLLYQSYIGISRDALAQAPGT